MKSEQFNKSVKTFDADAFIDAYAGENDEMMLSEAEKIFQISDETISESIEEKNETKKKRSGKKSSAEDVVKAYLENKTDRNWQKLQEKYWFGIFDYALMFVKQKDTAKDMVAETFIKALKAIDSFDAEKAKFSTWLWTICRNNCLLYLKQRSKLPTVDSDISDIYDSTMVGTCKGGNLTTSEYVVSGRGELETVSADEITQKLYDASIAQIREIGGTTGKILDMKLVQNMKIREIGEELDMNESTVKNYLYKGKEELLRQMKRKHKDLYEMYLDSCAEKDQLEI